MFLLLDTGGNCHKIAIEHDRLLPSISASSEDKKGNLFCSYAYLTLSPV